MLAIFLILKIGADSVNFADSRDIKYIIYYIYISYNTFCPVPWEFDFQNFLDNFKCVGGVYLRGRNQVKMSDNVSKNISNIRIHLK